MNFHFSVSTILATSFSVVIIAFILRIRNKKLANDDKNRKPPPQAKGAWPIIGHLHLLGASQLPHKVLGDMAEEHGPIFTIKLGSHQALVVSNVELARDCLATNDKAFASRPRAQAFELMAYNYAVVGFTPYGDYWRQIRKVIVLEMLSQRRVEMLGNIRVSELRASIRSLYDAWLKNNKSGNSDMVKVDMSHWFGELVLNVLVRIISGKRFAANDEEATRFQVVIRRYFELLGAFVVSDFVPYLKPLDLGGYTKAMKATANELDNIIEGWFEEKKAQRESAVPHEGNQVLMDVLISTLEGASDKEFPGFDHDTIVKATCHQLLTAGLDTTSATLTWALTLLLNNPRALELAQAEIDEHVGRDRLVEESDVKNLVYLEAIIKETLRLYPAAPLDVPHESIEDCVVGGYHITKGTRLLVNLSKIHRDPNNWSNPNEFQPERFLTSQKHIDVKGNHFELIPFSSGRRMCPGYYLALQELRITLASLIQQYTLKKPSNKQIDMTESAGITIDKKTPLEVLLAPRLSLHLYDDAGK
ncbi:cytochrome P450 [Artemisia annua]|uniref:Cytochrome P450 n=1 Tax=Artemisia annua TaxID=35608 RepID=A0A2U1NLX4_ARTAN|nr:cytochrome P450 [Artemisia annua]